MNQNPRTASRVRKWLLGLLLVLVVLGVSGCQTLSYYGQAIQGQYQIITHQQKIEKLLADPDTPAPLKAKLQLVQTLRTFAAKDLKLPVDGHYQKYVDVQRPYVVWNVEAAREFSLEAKSWWYPFVGSLDYRGYFSESGARKYAARLEKKGYEVCVEGVTAYSTLNWFRDPLLNTFIFEPEADLAETLFHELGHQRVFTHDDTDFNEAFATTVGQEGARRWLRAKGDGAEGEKYLAELRRRGGDMRALRKYASDWRRFTAMSGRRRATSRPRARNGRRRRRSYAGKSSKSWNVCKRNTGS